MRIVLTGDSLFSSRNLLHRIDPKVVEILKGADAVFTNAEFSTPKRGTPPGFTMYLTSVRQDTLDEFCDLNIKLVAFANNHTSDYGWQGCKETIEAAEERGLIPCGIGMNLDDARKARFLDTAKGRVGVVAASSTWAEKSVASMENADVVARPGLCPLRWGRTYVLPDKEFEELRNIDEMLGTKSSMAEVSKVECWPLADNCHFKFGSAMNGYLSVERGEKACVKTFADQDDMDAILKSIKDASRRSDAVIASIHTHEGINENWYAPEPPEFIEEFCHKAVDAGANVVVGHGAHYARGAEVYNGVPIFYNLGSILMEFESGESMISPEMYHTYGWKADARPSDLHGGRAKNPDGSWNGFYSERRFSENILVIMDIEDGKTEFQIVPIDIDMIRPNCLKRGLPEVASPTAAGEITNALTKYSKKYGTKFVYHQDVNNITIE